MQEYQYPGRELFQLWKLSHILKGALTRLPLMNAWRRRRGATGGSDSARYCYAVWMRHLVTLDEYGFRIKGAQIGELGPGDSIGIGLAALLCGAASYVGLDIVPFSAKSDLETIFDELVKMFWGKEPIPDHHEFPYVRPMLESYEFPNHLIDWNGFPDRVQGLRSKLGNINCGQVINYRAPWHSPADVAAGTLDLIFSQAVLEHVDSLPETYQAMSAWLRPGGYASHVIDFSAHYLSPHWNGHWAYSDWEWRLVRGRREFLLNREPINTHLLTMEKSSFEILLLERDYATSGIEIPMLSKRFRLLDTEDSRTRGARLILRKRNVVDS